MKKAITSQLAQIFFIYVDIYYKNDEFNTYYDMKQRIRLTEQDLHRIVKESVNKILNEARSGDWNQYRLNDFAHDVLEGDIYGKGIIKTYTGEIIKYKMKGRSLMIDFSQYNDGGPGWAREFIENSAQDYPEYNFSLDPSDMDENRMIVRCSYDEEWGI